jgi:hypothetical protein
MQPRACICATAGFRHYPRERAIEIRADVVGASTTRLNARHNAVAADDVRAESKQTVLGTESVKHVRAPR